jgi:hypothetical protein
MPPLFDGKRSILDSVADDSPKDTSKSVAPKQPTEIEDNLTFGQSGTVPHVPPSPPNSQPSAQSRQDTTPPWKKRLEYIAAGIGLGLLVVNVFQSCSTKNSADAAKSAADTAVLAEQPWVAIKKITIAGVSLPNVNNPQFILEYKVVNYGHQIADLHNVHVELLAGDRAGNIPEKERVANSICDPKFAEWDTPKAGPIGNYGILPNGQDAFTFRGKYTVSAPDANYPYRLFVAGCAFYHSMADRETRWHHTQFTGELASKIDGACPEQNAVWDDIRTGIRFSSGPVRDSLCAPYVFAFGKID